MLLKSPPVESNLDVDLCKRTMPTMIAVIHEIQSAKSDVSEVSSVVELFYSRLTVLMFKIVFRYSFVLLV